MAGGTSAAEQRGALPNAGPRAPRQRVDAKPIADRALPACGSRRCCGSKAATRARKLTRSSEVLAELPDPTWRAANGLRTTQPAAGLTSDLSRTRGETK